MQVTPMRVKRLSSVLFWVVSAGLILVPAAAVLSFSMDPPDLADSFPNVAIADPLPGWTPGAVFAAGLLPIAAALFVLWQMRALFRLYKRGEMLSSGCALAILRIGAGVLAVMGLKIMAFTLQVLALTLGNPPGKRSLAIAIDSSDLGMMLAGAFVLVIGWVILEAARIAEDHRSIV